MAAIRYSSRRLCTKVERGNMGSLEHASPLYLIRASCSATYCKCCSELVGLLSTSLSCLVQTEPRTRVEMGRKRALPMI